MARELAILLWQIHSEERDEFDKEVERLSRMDCDDAARKLSRDEFRRIAEEALKTIKKRKLGEGKSVLAYA